jgi:hypothetical protein
VTPFRSAGNRYCSNRWTVIELVHFFFGVPDTLSANPHELSGSTLPASPGRRAAFAVSLALAVAVYVIAVGKANPDFTSDFDQVWAGAKALWNGKNPYAVVGPGREFHWRWPLYYPLPALVLVAPLGLLPVLAARAIFAGVGAGMLAWGATRGGWQRLPIFISISFLVTVELGQWSALYAAAFFLPGLAIVGMAKPNFGLVLGAGARKDATLVYLVAGSLLLLAISQFIDPTWHRQWLQNLSEAPHFRAPVLRPLGFLLLLAAVRWRRPEARWLLTLSLVPQAPSFYDQILLGVVCLTSRESLIFASSTVLLFFYVGFNTPQPDYPSWGKLVGDATVWFCYFPILVMVLRRPNEGEVPAFFGLTRLILRPFRESSSASPEGR